MKEQATKLKNFILLFISIIFSLLLCEFILYITGLSPSVYPIKISSWDSEYILSPNKALFYEPKPNTGRFNKQGYIGDYLAPEKKLKRILFFGDSVTYGVGCPIQENFVTLLQSNFKGKYEIANFAVPGYNIIQYYEHLNKNGIQFSPDIVIICICENDFLIKSPEIASFEEVLQRNKNGRFYQDYYHAVNSSKKLLQHSNIYRFITFYYLRNTQDNSEYEFKNEYYKSEDFVNILEKFERIQHAYNLKIFFVLLPTPPTEIQQRRINKLKFFLSYTKKLHILDLNSEIRRRYNQKRILSLFRDTWHLNKTGHLVVFDYFKNMLPKIIRTIK